LRPIDIIRTKTDSDLMKYHPSTLCVIPTDQDVKDFVGVGVMAMVVPITEYDAYQKKKNELKTFDGKLERFPVLIANRPSGWIETEVSSKYNVLTLNSVQDRVSFSVGFLVPKTLFRHDIAWNGLKTSEGESVENITVEHNTKGEMG